jgi:hypothetical protein
MTVTIGRRELIAALGGAAVAWPQSRRTRGVWGVRAPTVGTVRAGSEQHRWCHCPFLPTKSSAGPPFLIQGRKPTWSSPFFRPRVYKRARQVGLELCPAEVAPKLRLDYRDQPLGDALNIAMEPVATHSGEPTILALVNFGTGLALIGSDGRSKFMVPRTWRFVFALPTHDRLEAMRETPQIVPE